MKSENLFSNEIALPYAVAIVGPTASGKTALALQLAKEIGGEIVSADSMQIYSGMDVGTAKASKEERTAVPHHMVDVLPPSAPYSAADYGVDALSAVKGILSRNRVPLFCGGTGLYLNAAVTGRHTPLPSMDESIRARLLEEASTPEGQEALYRELCRVDNASAMQIPKQNVRRIIRALEIYLSTGKTKTAWDEESRRLPPAIRTLTFFLDFKDRSLLYERIDRRVDAMMAEGLEEEVRRLWKAGILSADTTAGQAIGYKEMLAYLEGSKTKEEAVAAIKIATRHYAKRQQTWFRALPDATRVCVDKEDGTLRQTDDICKEILPAVNRFINDAQASFP